MATKETEASEILTVMWAASADMRLHACGEHVVMTEMVVAEILTVRCGED